MTELTEEEQIKKIKPLVEKMARSLMGRLPPSIDINDLIQAGLMGALSAFRKKQPEGRAPLITYIRQRIQGEMLDELRRLDVVCKQHRQELTRSHKATKLLEHKLGRRPTKKEIAESIGVTISEYCKMLGVATVELHAFEETDSISEDDGPEGLLAKKELIQMADCIINSFGGDKSKMMHLYHDKFYSLKAIGDELGICESRVSQIHKATLSKLRKRLILIGG